MSIIVELNQKEITFISGGVAKESSALKCILCEASKIIRNKKANIMFFSAVVIGIAIGYSTGVDLYNRQEELYNFIITKIADGLGTISDIKALL